MRKLKLFTFLLALTASVGLMNAKVTWNSSNISNLVVNGSSYSQEGVTLGPNANNNYAYWLDYGNESQNGIYFYVNATGGHTFSNSLGKNFTKIEMTLNGSTGWNVAYLGSGWNIDGMKVIWTGNASTVGLLTETSSFGGAAGVKSIVFYFEGDSEEPDPTPVVNLKLIEFQVPASWENDNSPITSADFPDFVATTYEIASALPGTSEPALVVFDFHGDDEVTVYSKVGGQVKEPSTGSISRETFFGNNTQVHYYYPVLDDPEPEPQPEGDDKLSGAFSVDDGKVVYFSKGNLQATTNDQGATWTWAFAANQYDYIGKAAANNAINGNGTVSTNGTVDLFGWSTSYTSYGIHNSTDNGTYYASFVDWSSNTDLKASLGEGWRTLTSSEWVYLLDSRTTTSGVRYAKATVNNVAGLIILPDNWDEAYHALVSTNNPDVDFSGNEISSDEWASDFQAHGAVFLPAAGNRSGTNVSEAGSAGYYWSATSVDGYTAYYMRINGSELSANIFNLLIYGRSVRLVSDIAPIPTSGSCGDNLTWEFNTETGALTISGTGAMTSAPWETYYKAAITSLSLPDGLTAIPSEAFKGCTGLTTVTIPASVTSIGADAFHGCTSVTDVYCYPKAADLDWNDYYTDDFIEYPAIETRCHVYADECSEYIARYSQGDGVNVTFMNDLEAVAVTTNEDPQNPAVYYSTFYHGTKKYRLPNDGTEAYVADLSGSDLRLTKIADGDDVLPNGVAVILKAPGTNVTLFPTEAEPVTFTAHNDLLGVDAETAAPANCYVLSGTDQYGVGFYRINSENLKAHKAYVIYTGSAAPKRMRFVFNQATDVESIQPSAVSNQKILENGQVIIIRNGVRYNAAGQIVK